MLQEFVHSYPYVIRSQLSYPFNVRVYGLLIEDKSKILIADEYFNDTFITKFPGGGLQFGEGTIECLKREFKEELDLEVDVVSHFYTTDFFQASAFDKTKQIISIYYVLLTVQSHRIKTTEKKFDFKEIKNDVQSFRWINFENLSPDEMTFPIDKTVVELLLKKFL